MKHLILLLLLLQSPGLRAQWHQFTLPQGLPSESIVRHHGYYFTSYLKAVFRSSDGVHWEEVNTPDPDLANINYYRLISGDSLLYANLIYVSKGLFKSNDNGDTWVQTNLPSNNSKYEVISSGTSLYAYYPDGDQLFRSTDNGENWTVVFSENTPNVKGINSVAVRDTTLLLLNSYHLMRSSNGGDDWEEASSTIKGHGDGLNTAFSTIAAPADNIWFVQQDKYGMYRSTNDGLDWEYILFPQASTFPARMEYHQGRLWMTGIAVFASDYYAMYSDDGGDSWSNDPMPGTNNHLLSAGDTLFVVGDKGCYYSADNGNTWYSGNHGNQFHPLAPSGVTDRFFVSGDRLFSAGFISPDIFYSDNEGETWRFVKDDIPGSFFVKGDTIISTGSFISFDGGEHFISFDEQGFSEFAFSDSVIFGSKWTSGILKSKNGGMSWLNVNFPGDLSLFRNMVCAKNALWVLTAIGVYASFDQGDSWQQYNTGILDLSNLYYGEILGGDDHLVLRAKDHLYYFDSDQWRSVEINGLSFSPYDLLEYLGQGRVVYIRYSFETEVFISEDGGRNWAKIISPFPPTEPFVIIPGEKNIHCLGNDAANQGLFFFKRIWADISIGNIEGMCYNDENANNAYDPGEPPLVNVPVYLSDNRLFAWTDTSGRYRCRAELAEDDELQFALYSDYYQATPKSYTVGTAGGVFDFAVQLADGARDLTLTATNTGAFRPGFFTDIVLTINNIGVDSIAPTLHFPLPGFLEFESALPAPSSFTGNDLSWQLPVLPPLMQTDIRLRVRTAIGTPLDTIFSITSEVLPLLDDLSPNNNRSTIRVVVVGSYDPNDKTCEPGFISPDMAQNGEELVYTVRFQNTGSYEATFVVIRDTLSPNLDAGTATPLSASHPYRFIRRDGNVLEIVFDSIHLPDSISDEPGSHGFIKFAVRTIPGLQVGESIENRAAIYFDYNLPVITNTVSTQVQTVHTHETAGAGPCQLKILPNPASKFVNVVPGSCAGDGITAYRVVDLLGRTVLDLSADAGYSDVSPLNSGIYLVWALAGEEKRAAGRLIICSDE